MELDIRRPEGEEPPGKSPRVPRRLRIVSHANRLKAKPAGIQARTAALMALTSAKFLPGVA
jgi:hypothetical protein